MTVSYLPELLKLQTKYEVGEISVSDLEAGNEHIQKKLTQFKENGIPYVLVDSTEEMHLEQILQMTSALEYTFAWAGSAGIANYLPGHFNLEGKSTELTIPGNSGPILTVVGSVNKNSRAQLKKLLGQTSVSSVAFHSFKAVSAAADRTEEMERVYKEVKAKSCRPRRCLVFHGRAG